MSSSNAIGSASVVLSANADGLAAGLDKAERKVEGFGDGVGKKLGGAGGGGGFLSKLAGGAALAGAAGAVAGTVAAGVMKGFEVLAGIPDLIRGLAEKAQGPEAGPLKGIVRAMDRVGEAAQRIGGKLFAAMGPGIAAIADVAEGLADRFGGLAERVGSGLGAALTVGVELAGELITLVAEAAEGFFAWGAGLDGVADDANHAAKWIFDSFRAVGKGAAWAWDVVKAGAGVIAWVAGKIVTGLGHAIEAFRSVVDLAKSLPDSLRPAWVDSFSDAVGNAGTRVQEIGRGMADWGAGAVRGFGDSAAKVDEWMDGVERRFASRRDQLAKVAGVSSSKLGGALAKGSAEAYSVVTKFNTDAMVSAADPAKQAAKKQDETNRLLREIARGIAGAQLLRTV